MGDLPLHPAIVHLPLGLALVLPLLVAVFTWRAFKGTLSVRTWALVPAALLIVLVSGLAAERTGEADEELVERVVAESQIGHHEELAEQFVLATGALLLLSLGGLAPAPALRKGVPVALLIGSLGLAAQGARVGHAGGELVYVHGAASAHLKGGSAAGAYPPGSGGAQPDPGGAAGDKDDD